MIAAISRGWHWLMTPRRVRVAAEKRRLQRAAQDAGCSRTQAMHVVSNFYKNHAARANDVAQ